VSVVVIGGGFAGIAAAGRLAAAGAAPIVLERAPRLGGRASSARFPATGEAIDLGQHILMGCCTASDGFLRRIGRGSAISFQEELEIPVRCGSVRTVLRSSALLPGPLHLAPSLLRYRPLPPVERRRAALAAVRLLIGGRGEERFAAWLRRRGQSERAISRLWDPISIAALNAPAARVAVSAARQVFVEGFFRPGGANIGLFTEPLSAVFDAGRDYIVSRGGRVETGLGAAGIRSEGGAVCAVETADGQTIDASAVVAAVPPWDLAPLVAAIPEMAEGVERGLRLRWAPIIDVHLWFERPVAEEPFFIAVDAPVLAVFDLSRIHKAPSNPGGPCAHLVVSRSAADPWIDRPADEIVDEVIGSLARVLPAARRARVEHRLVIRHRRATFVRAPGSDRLRPASTTRVRGLHLAGDWTATGWPSTIEGAIRSGIAAAAAVEIAEGAPPDPSYLTI